MGEIDKQLSPSGAAAGPSEDDHSSIGLFRSEMLKHTGASDKCTAKSAGGTYIGAFAALRSVFRANELRFK